MKIKTVHAIYTSHDRQDKSHWDKMRKLINYTHPVKKKKPNDNFKKMLIEKINSEK